MDTSQEKVSSREEAREYLRELRGLVSGLTKNVSGIGGLYDSEAAPRHFARRRQSDNEKRKGYDVVSRPIEAHGYMMRSVLEQDVARWLDMCCVRWEYEPCMFEANGVKYIPDFRTEARGHTLYIEAKPEGVAWRNLDEIKRKMETIWHHEPDAHLLIFTPGVSKWIGKDGQWFGRKEAPVHV